MKLSKLLIGAAFVLSSAFAVATPVYNGPTAADGADVESSMTSAGYYLWNEESDTSRWSLRWTGAGADASPVTWGGSIQFLNRELNSYEEFMFETNDMSGVSALPGLGDIVWFDAVTNNRTPTPSGANVDGIDFILDPNYEVMRFSLTSSLWNVADFTATTVTEGTDINIGYGPSATPDVLVSIQDGNVYQQFEVQVPEPSALLLLGLGLAGLGFSRRRRVGS